jgi:hypothetical protein
MRKEEMLFFGIVPRGVKVRTTDGWNRLVIWLQKDRTLHTIKAKTQFHTVF